MKIGANQFLILKRCSKKGFVTINDIRIVYGRSSKTDSRVLFSILEKMEFYGWLQKFDRYKFSLTKEGEEVLGDHLPKVWEG